MELERGDGLSVQLGVSDTASPAHVTAPRCVRDADELVTALSLLVALLL